MAYLLFEFLIGRHALLWRDSAIPGFGPGADNSELFHPEIEGCAV